MVIHYHPFFVHKDDDKELSDEEILLQRELREELEDHPIAG